MENTNRTVRRSHRLKTKPRVDYREISDLTEHEELSKLCIIQEYKIRALRKKIKFYEQIN
tara:strand:- start:1163 stop:1342 length:180 start_codon:yes stop_codon:yes gene_type:complete